MSNKDEVEALCERLLTAKDDDHERGCQMRFALCSCGFDDARARTAGEAAAMLSALADENAELRAAKWAVQHVDTMNDLVAMGLARDAAEARAIAAEEALIDATDHLANVLFADPGHKETVSRREATLWWRNYDAALAQKEGG